MARGKRAQADFDSRQGRHRLARLGFADPVRHPHLFLHSRTLCLTGRADLVLEGPARVAPVEVKYSTNAPGPGYLLQSTAYALLAEEHFQKRCPVAFFYHLPGRQWTPVAMDDARRSACISAIRAVQEILGSPDLPAPTPLRARCEACEFLRFCGDRF